MDQSFPKGWIAVVCALASACAPLEDSAGESEEQVEVARAVTSDLGFLALRNFIFDKGCITDTSLASFEPKEAANDFSLFHLPAHCGGRLAGASSGGIFVILDGMQITLLRAYFLKLDPSGQKRFIPLGLRDGKPVQVQYMSWMEDIAALVNPTAARLATDEPYPTSIDPHVDQDCFDCQATYISWVGGVQHYFEINGLELEPELYEERWAAATNACAADGMCESSAGCVPNEWDGGGNDCDVNLVPELDRSSEPLSCTRDGCTGDGCSCVADEPDCTCTGGRYDQCRQNKDQTGVTYCCNFSGDCMEGIKTPHAESVEFEDEDWKKVAGPAVFPLAVAALGDSCEPSEGPLCRAVGDGECAGGATRATQTCAAAPSCQDEAVPGTDYCWVIESCNSCLAVEDVQSILGDGYPPAVLPAPEELQTLGATCTPDEGPLCRALGAGDGECGEYSTRAVQSCVAAPACQTEDPGEEYCWVIESCDSCLQESDPFVEPEVLPSGDEHALGDTCKPVEGPLCRALDGTGGECGAGTVRATQSCLAAPECQTTDPGEEFCWTIESCNSCVQQEDVDDIILQCLPDSVLPSSPPDEDPENPVPDPTPPPEEEPSCASYRDTVGSSYERLENQPSLTESVRGAHQVGYCAEGPDWRDDEEGRSQCQWIELFHVYSCRGDEQVMQECVAGVWTQPCIPRGVEDCEASGDEDGDDLTNCDDPQCSWHPSCRPEICNNGFDDDGDGDRDCHDSQCEYDSSCVI